MKTVKPGTGFLRFVVDILNFPTLFKSFLLNNIVKETENLEEQIIKKIKSTDNEFLLIPNGLFQFIFVENSNKRSILKIEGWVLIRGLRLIEALRMVVNNSITDILEFLIIV